MQQFTVPQFIDVEDKIIGPVTTRQFLIILAAAIVIAIFYKIFDFSLFVVSGLLTLAVSGVIAFLRINGRPFHYFILNLIQTFKRPNTRVWYKKLEFEAVEAEPDAMAKHTAVEQRAKPSVSRLAELSLIVDTQGMYKGESSEGDKVSIESLEEERKAPKIELNF